MGYSDRKYQFKEKKPRVTIGMPVYNAEQYLKEALNAILGQTYSDFEIIISDNCSTDNTKKICQEYANKDNRVLYFCNKKNLGAPKNFNSVFELSSGEYFKWAAHDDLYAPTYLEKCVNVLDNDVSTVLCHSKTGFVDQDGNIAYKSSRIRTSRMCSKKPNERIGEFLSIRNPVWPFYGLMRRQFLKQTPLQGNYMGADRNLMVEIALMGRIYEIPEFLFFGREHSKSYTGTFYGDQSVTNEDKYYKQLSWWAQKDWITFPTLKNYLEYFNSVKRVKLTLKDKLLCYNQIYGSFMREGWLLMENDVENLFMRRSFYGRKVIMAFRSNLRRGINPIKSGF